MDMKLETRNLSILFEFRRKISPTQYYFSIIIEFKDPQFPNLIRKNCMLSIQDLRDLKDFFTSHISNLRKLGDDLFAELAEYPVFVNLDLDFNIRALLGTITGDSGEFSMRFSIVMADKDRYYIGIEDVFDMLTVRNFLFQLDGIIDNHDNEDYEREDI